MSTKTKKSTWFFTILLSIALLGFINELYKSAVSSPKETSIESQIYDIAEMYIRSYLKSPSIASFDHSSKYIKKPGNTYIIFGQVDAHNSFGAVITSAYTCEIKYTEDKEWKLISLELEK